MKRLLFAVFCAFVCAPYLGTCTEMTPEQLAERRRNGRARRIAMNGGQLDKIIPGKIVRIVNAQKKAGTKGIDGAIESMREILSLSFEVVPGECGKTYRPDDRAGVVIVLADADKDTTLLVAPEQAWASISTLALAKDNPTAEVLDVRVHKEICRALTMVLGAANSMNPTCLMHQVNTLAELDAGLAKVPCPEPLNKLYSTTRKLGLGRTVRVSYRLACKEGWAPEPTNTVQSAIWEEYHSKPTEPIRIKYDAKKGL